VRADESGLAAFSSGGLHFLVLRYTTTGDSVTLHAWFALPISDNTSSLSWIPIRRKGVFIVFTYIYFY
jgi:hypothetical protein